MSNGTILTLIACIALIGSVIWNVLYESKLRSHNKWLLGVVEHRDEALQRYYDMYADTPAEYKRLKRIEMYAIELVRHSHPDTINLAYDKLRFDGLVKALDLNNETTEEQQ